MTNQLPEKAATAPAGILRRSESSHRTTQRSVSMIVPESSPRLKRRFPVINVEPVFFFFSLYNGLFTSVTSIFGYYKVCMFYASELMPESEVYCRDAKTADNQTELAMETIQLIQTDTVRLTMWLQICNVITALFSSLAIGAWSDRFGRKPFIVACIAGGFSYPLAMIFSATFIHSTPNILLIGNLIQGIFGTGVFMLTSSAIRDQFPDKRELAIRMTFLNSVNHGGIVFGSLFGSLLTGRISYPYIILSAICVKSLSFFWGVFIFRETLPKKRRRSTSIIREPSASFSSVLTTLNIPLDVRSDLESRTVSFFESIGLLKVVGILTKKQAGSKQKQLLLGLLAFILFVIALGAFNIMLPFVKLKPLSWSNALFVQQSVLISAVSAIGVPLLVILLKKFLFVHDTIIIMLGLFAEGCRMVIISLARETWHIFASAAFGVAGGMVFPAFRSYLVHLVAEHDTVVEAIGPLLGTLIFNNLYPLTLSILPGMMFDVGAGLILIPAFMMLHLFFEAKKRPPQELAPLDEISGHRRIYTLPEAL